MAKVINIFLHYLNFTIDVKNMFSLSNFWTAIPIQFEPCKFKIILDRIPCFDCKGEKWIVSIFYHKNQVISFIMQKLEMVSFCNLLMWKLLPFGYPPGIFVPYLLSNLTDKHCQMVSKMAKFFTFTNGKRLPFQVLP